jgi:TPR repeat protein/serine/threonine protein kinase
MFANLAAPFESSSGFHNRSASAEITLAQGVEPVPGYRLVAPLGKGGFGEVWRAEGPGVAVAMKFVDLAQKTGAVEQRALEMMKNIRHAHVLPLFGAWQVGHYLVIAMELADGSLFQRFHQRQREGHAGIPEAELLSHMQDTARALDYLNLEKHLQHRDIKPHNLLLVSGCVKVADFGLMKVLESTLGSHTGGMSLAYSPPEFFSGQTAATSDQYALAVTYYHLRAGKLPFDGTQAQVMRGHMLHAPELSELTAAERRVVGRALHKDPKQRWPSCCAFVQALGAAPAAWSPPASSQPTTPRRTRPCQAEEMEMGTLPACTGTLRRDKAPSIPAPVAVPSLRAENNRSPLQGESWVSVALTLFVLLGCAVGGGYFIFSSFFQSSGTGSVCQALGAVLPSMPKPPVPPDHKPPTPPNPAPPRLDVSADLAAVEKQLLRSGRPGEFFRELATEKLPLWKAAAELGSPAGAILYGLCHLENGGLQGNPAEAMRHFRWAAEQNQPLGQWLLAEGYDKGNGVPQNHLMAVQWYRRAAEQNFVPAQLALAVCYSEGRGVVADEAEAFRWYGRAAAQGNPLAQNSLGFYYRTGTVVPKDANEAVHWFRRAALQNHPEAQGNLGVCYLKGEGVSRNEAEAVYWLRRAVAQNNANAQAWLGLCYLRGTGVTKDLTEARRWLNKAASQGSGWARQKLREIEQAPSASKGASS